MSKDQKGEKNSDKENTSGEKAWPEPEPYSVAMKRIEASLHKNPKDTTAWQNKAFYLEKIPHQIPQAIDCYKKVIKLSPESLHSHLELAQLQFRQRDYGGALDTVIQYFKHPLFSEEDLFSVKSACILKASTLARLGQYTDALDLFLLGDAHISGDRVSREEMAETFFYLGHPDEGSLCISTYYKEHPGCEVVLCRNIKTKNLLHKIISMNLINMVRRTINENQEPIPLADGWSSISKSLPQDGLCALRELGIKNYDHIQAMSKGKRNTVLNDEAPEHPGPFIKREIIDPSGMSDRAVALEMGITPQALDNFIKKRYLLVQEWPSSFLLFFLNIQMNILWACKRNLPFLRKGKL